MKPSFCFTRYLATSLHIKQTSSGHVRLATGPTDEKKLFEQRMKRQGEQRNGRLSLYLPKH
jgi:hypothetical protein